ncbi:MAG: dTDP-4-dehydrorhamnose 3,5-epimerase [Candidatus Delongbacteria bacterium]|nr:dTDP-4-dehydrorhamnose 3,5-epimerase [Candidatus Delongbacteria bacterium]MBN2836940.1 dTDP-4-dehydrorhamnose 3,5-epimerase [Candidatus Delongbacteria bacterium]
MKIIRTHIEDVIIIEPDIYRDARGFFLESYNKSVFDKLGVEVNFVQDNRSLSTRGVLRGLHFQKGDSAQAKLVSVISGTVLDIAVDIRKGSKTFGQHVSTELNSETKRMMFIPRGFAHGFIVLSESAEFIYKCDNYYNPSSEGGIRFDDPDINLDWRLDKEELIISDKDKKLPYFKEILDKL